MNNINNNSTRYTFEELLKDTRIHKIEIPRIQRDYAQGRTDKESTRIRKNFISALYTALTNGQNINLDFVYGNIDKDGTLTLLDGQQRLTTLFLLHWYIAQKNDTPDNEKSNIEVLKKFSYESRHSTRDFCAKLLAFNPFSNPEQDLAKENSKISDEIINQNWFPLSWKKDPSIVSMLTMLDEIHKQFKNSSVTWKDLSKITFYFLALEDMGLTDDLYIKMNSRGKPLTDFEHFKAELDKQLTRLNEFHFADEIKKKFDTTWTDLLWEYRNSGTNTENDTVVDDEFLRYIHFICDVISCKEGNIPEKEWNEFDLLENFFTQSDKNDKEKVQKNFETLQSFFDCWCEENLCKIKCTTPEEFLSSFINKSANYEKNKIITPYSNIFKECLAKYTTDKFTLKQFVFLYAVVCYLQHIDKIEYTDFIRRIRIINNLIQNSGAEITQRRMKDILEQVEEILKTGEVEEKENTFNKYQLTEEKQKLALLKKLKNHPEFNDISNTLFTLEDHELLYGQLSILFDFTSNITQENIKTASKFIPLFKCDYDKIDCALMAITGEKSIDENNGAPNSLIINDYSQKISSDDWRGLYQFGTNNQESWKELFHQHIIYDFYSKPKLIPKNDFAKTRNSLLQLLEEIKNNKDKNEIKNLLEEKKNNFISKCENKKLYPFEYYYVKYLNFRPGKNDMSGKCYRYDKYNYTILQYNDAHGDNYNPYFKEACGEKLFEKYKAFNLGQRRLKFTTCNIKHLYFYGEKLKDLNAKLKISVPYPQDLFVIYDDNNNYDDNNIILPIIINQNEDKIIDTENRIDKLKKYIELIIEYEKEHQDAAGLKEYIENNV